MLQTADFMNNIGKCSSVEEMFGHLSPADMKVVCDALYIQNPNFKIRCLTSKGELALFRAAENDRRGPRKHR